MPLMISRIGHARGRPVLFAAGRWGSITHHSLSVTSVWYRFVSRICCIRVVGVHMGSPGLVSATPWNHADASHSTSFETASEANMPAQGSDGGFQGAVGRLVNVRYESNSDRFSRRSEMTLCAKS